MLSAVDIDPGTRPAPASTAPAAVPPEGAHAHWASASPPAIVLGGGANALSVARSLARAGAAVYCINEPDAYVRYSRYCRWLDVPAGADLEESWTRFLLGSDSDPLQGSVLLTCSDAGIRLIARHREALGRRYRLDLSNPDAQLRMLDKLSTYQQAQAAGVPAPGFWTVESAEQLDSLRDALPFPLLVKPRLSHLFEERFGKKFLVAASHDQLRQALEALSGTGIEVLLMELVPGGDELLASYYTYLDEQGRPLFHFTKRVIRRFPVGSGTACYHVTDWNPEVAELGLRLCNAAGLRGLGNVEFKRDPRDGQLKLIECNARFTASNCLVARSGFDLAAFVYNRIVGRPQPPLERYAVGLRLWDPIRDFQAHLDLRRRGELTTRAWLRSVMHRQSFPYFQWTDPLPALLRISKPVRDRLRRGPARG